MNGYIAKPLDGEKMISALKNDSRIICRYAIIRLPSEVRVDSAFLRRA